MTTYTYSVRNPSDENETSSWICEASSEIDAAHQYLAEWWSAEKRDDGSWYSPTYSGDIDGDDLIISHTNRSKNWIKKSAQSGEITHVGRDACATTEELDELLALCDDSADNTSVAGEYEYWGTTDGGSTWRVHVEMDC